MVVLTTVVVVVVVMTLSGSGNDTLYRRAAARGCSDAGRWAAVQSARDKFPELDLRGTSRYSR